MEPFLGQIVGFAGNFAPRGWAFCDGQLLPISQYSALFSLLGTVYGGDGRTTFALPDMRGRVWVHPGNGPGLSSYRLGERTGVESVTLNVQQMPPHNHPLHGEAATADSRNATGNMLAVPVTTGGDNPVTAIYAAPNANDDRVMANESITNTGGGQGHTNLQPLLCVNMIIALQGTFPSRS